MLKLVKKQNLKSVTDKVLLVILDGVGYTEKGADAGNAIAGAKIPTLSNLWNHHSTVHIKAHGKAVGMPSDEDMGNSEVGHNVLGCGRIFDQGAKLVSNSIDSGQLFQGEVWKELIANAKTKNSTLHLLGLLSDGNVHSHIDHLKALVAAAKKEGVSKVRIHTLLDGRDVPEKSALEYVRPFEKFLSELRDANFDAKIASGGGRMTITMDRYEADWSMVERGWNFHVKGEGRAFSSAEEAIETFRKEDPAVIDQYLPGFVVSDANGPVGKIKDGDSVVFFNFRGDRAIEISLAMTADKFDKFNRGPKPDVYYAGMMQYDGDLKLPDKYLVTPPAIDRTLSEYLISEKLQQYAISETQKYGHVTFFWNGNKSGYLDRNLETFQEIPSDVIPFDQAPEMKAKEITDTLISTLETKKYNFVRVNYANGDMVGHTGNYAATVRSLEFLDSCMERLKASCDKNGYTLLVTADHGNADEMYQLDKKGNAQKQGDKFVPKTSHTLNPVNLVIYDKDNRWKLKGTAEAGLGNIAATVLDLLGYEAPEGYLPSLLERL
ncbi:MAG: 2,3-bisphosphoglycerate-independent phosphoglycerate mutase [Leptospiraceae bacterium]|nr:2,3-bisphosphoglycerate-independent phosphoglycerate mutase [Leptospiraceae bacterium]